MTWRKHYASDGAYRPMLPGADAVVGNIASSDVGKLILLSSNHGVFAGGSTADIGYPSTRGIAGILAVVPNASTPGSTVLFYVDPIRPGEVVEVDWSTLYEASSGLNLIVTSNIGKWFTFGNTTSSTDYPAAGAVLDPTIAGNLPGTSEVFFFQLQGFSTQNDVAWGIINSSHLAL